MHQYGTWATDAEVLSTANLFDHDIVIYCANGLDSSGVVNRSWLRYPASFTLSFNTDRAIYFDHFKGNHFEVVLSTTVVQ